MGSYGQIVSYKGEVAAMNRHDSALNNAWCHVETTGRLTRSMGFHELRPGADAGAVCFFEDYTGTTIWR